MKKNFYITKRYYTETKRISSETILLYWQFTIKTLDELDIVSNQNIAIEMFLLRLMYLKKINSDSQIIGKKNLSENDLKNYLNKINTETLLSYGVYQIEADGRSLFSEIKGDEDTIMGLPVKKIKDYLRNFK